MAFSHAIRFLVSETDAIVSIDVTETLSAEFPEAVIEHLRDTNGYQVTQSRPTRVTIAILSSGHANQDLCDRFVAARAGVVILGDAQIKGAGVVTLPKPFSEEMLLGAIEDSLAAI